MIRYETGDLFSSHNQVLVNPVNLIGADGAGLAKQFSTRYPGLRAAYRAAIASGSLAVGRCWSWRAPDGRIVCCLPTKRDWRDSSRIEDIEAALGDLRQRLLARPLSIAIPMIGCGLGGLDWPDVRALIERELGDLEADVRVYGPAPAQDVMEEDVTTVHNKKREPMRTGDVYIGRGSAWGNPFAVGASAHAVTRVATVAEAIVRYEAYITERLANEPALREQLRALKGKRLFCFCKPGPCHGDVLARLANAVD